MGTFLRKTFLLGFTSALLENTRFKIFVCGLRVKNFFVEEVAGIDPSAGNSSRIGSSYTSRDAADEIDVMDYDFFIVLAIILLLLPLLSIYIVGGFENYYYSKYTFRL